MTTSTTSARPNAHDRLRSLYASPGPYTSMYLPCGAVVSESPMTVLDRFRSELAEQGTSTRALEALEARLGLPIPDHVGGWALHTADDGSTAVDFAPEGPNEPFVHVGALPVSAPLLEWDQWRVPHVTVTFGADVAEVATFIPGAEPRLTPLPVDTIQAASALRRLAIDEGLRLIVLVDDGGGVSGLAERLRGVIPPRTNLITLEQDEWSTIDDVVDTTVRYVADVVARDTVQALEDFRFMTASGHAVEGTGPVFDALARGDVQTLLVHDDPADPAMASFGKNPTDVSSLPQSGAHLARRADVAIWSALHQGVGVRIIPSTSSSGPDDNIGAVLRDSVGSQSEVVSQ